MKNSRTLVLDVEPSDTVLSVKQKIEDRDGIPLKYLSLSYAGSILEDGRQLSDYDVTREATIIYRVRLVPAQTP